jgi:hypothetical protein
MNTPKKINEDIEEEIKSYFFSHYNFKPNNIGYLSARIVKLFSFYTNPISIYRKSNISKYLSIWFKTTNIKGEIEKHSAHGFAAFIDANYYIITFNKKIWWHRLIYKTLKTLTSST